MQIGLWGRSTVAQGRLVLSAAKPNTLPAITTYDEAPDGRLIKASGLSGDVVGLRYAQHQPTGLVRRLADRYRIPQNARTQSAQ